MRPEKYTKMANDLTQKIVNGEFSRGEKLPSQQELAKKYRISRSCVHTALNVLDERGLIDRLPGKGIYIKNKSPHKKELKSAVYLLREEQKMRSNQLDNFGLEIMWGIENALRENNINFMLKKYSRHPDVSDELASLIKDMPVEGVIVDRDFPDALLKSAEIIDIPIVVCGKKSPLSKCGYSAPNFYDYFYQTFSMLLDEGWKDVRLMYSKSNIYKEDLTSAVKDFNAAKKANYKLVNFTKELKGWTDSEHLFVYSEMEKMIRENNLPEILMCASDWTAFRALEILQKHKIKAPEQVKIIGCLGLNIAAQSIPPISTLQVDAWEVGRKSVEALIKLYENNSFPAIEKVPLKFIERETFKWRDRK